MSRKMTRVYNRVSGEHERCGWGRGKSGPCLTNKCPRYESWRTGTESEHTADLTWGHESVLTHSVWGTCSVGVCVYVFACGFVCWRTQPNDSTLFWVDAMEIREHNKWAVGLGRWNTILALLTHNKQIDFASTFPSTTRTLCRVEKEDISSNVLGNGKSALVGSQRSSRYLWRVWKDMSKHWNNTFF